MSREGAVATKALMSPAQRAEQGRAASCIINYDIARRSHGIRSNLDRRNPGVRGTVREITCLQDIVESSYRPGRGISTAIAEETSLAVQSCRRHPFVEQLHAGTLKGRPCAKSHSRQFLASGTLCTVLSALLIVIGM